MKNFEEIKKLYLEQIKELKDVDTKDKKSGIYLIYIEGIDNDNYIPIYIGQSVNIYNRKSRHKVEIKKLFQLEKELYNKMIPLFSGKYLYCKIVSTLKNNNKTMDDIKFKILEYCDKKILNNKEKYWINYYQTMIYGFNQFQEIIDSNKIIASIVYGNKEKINWNEIAINGKNTLLEFMSKLDDFNENLKKYKYYQVNYSFLFGNLYELNKIMNQVSEEHYMEIDEGVCQELDTLLEKLDFKIKIYMTLFIKKGYILSENELYNRLSIEF